MNENEYSSYLDGIAYVLDKFDSIVVDSVIEKFDEATEKCYNAKHENKYSGLDGFHRYLGEQRAYEEIMILMKKFTKDLREQSKTCYR